MKVTNNLNLTTEAQPQSSYDEGFFEAARDLLSGWAKGNMIPYQYSLPLSPDDPVRGALLWEQFAEQHKDYYQSYEAEAVIQRACDGLPQILNRPISSYVDIGPGPVRSIEMKTARLLKTLQPTQYIPSDVSLSYLDDARLFVTENHPNIDVLPTVLNIMHDVSPFETDENSFYFLDGSTLMNIPEDEQTPNVEVGLRRNLRNVHRLMGGHGLFAFVHDTNQNEASLTRLYRHPIQDAFIMNVLYRMVRDLPINGFDPDAFSYELAWLPEQHLVAHRAVCEKDQDVVLGDLRFNLYAGQKLQLTHSYKLPESKVIAAATDSGFEHIASWNDGNDRLVFQLFRAPPALLH
ncbi:MAG: hypothetical protein EOM37_05445 [Proteobacteria bacterium]|nr:hypothetical protein [Pseudomonadota bacterium]